MLNLAQLIPPTFLQTTAATLYTATVPTRIDKLTITNTSGSSATATVYIGDGTSSLGPVNLITVEHSVASKATFNSPDVVGHVLPAGYVIQALSGTAGVLSIMASGVQQS